MIFYNLEEKKKIKLLQNGKWKSRLSSNKAAAENFGHETPDPWEGKFSYNRSRAEKINWGKLEYDAANFNMAVVYSCVKKDSWVDTPRPHFFHPEILPVSKIKNVYFII